MLQTGSQTCTLTIFVAILYKAAGAQTRLSTIWPLDAVAWLQMLEPGRQAGRQADRHTYTHTHTYTYTYIDVHACMHTHIIYILIIHLYIHLFKYLTE